MIKCIIEKISGTIFGITYFSVAIHIKDIIRIIF